MKELLHTEIYRQFKTAESEKNTIGRKGINDQSEINRRFYSGDQWGHTSSKSRPLVRYNVIRRIGDYKISTILSAPLSVRFSAIGDKADDKDVANAVNAMSDYFSVISERVGFDSVILNALSDSYITGTGAVYAYWDPEVRTGRYLDAERTLEIRGDVKAETVRVENLYFGDSECGDVQSQPYIIIARKLPLQKAISMALDNGMEIDGIHPDDDYSNKVTVYTRFRKVKTDSGEDDVLASITTQTAVIRAEFSLGVRVYPLAVFCWNDNKNSAYGESEITHIIPNQIAINRMLTASVWSVMLSGMPIMAVNRNLVPNQPLSNEPGQIIDYTGPFDQIDNTVKYFTPPDYLNNYNATVSALISQTLNQTGANAVALGDVDPVNTSAIIAVRDSAMSPLKIYKRRFYEFCSDVAKLFAEFFVMMYVHRKLDVKSGFVFEGERFRDLLIGCAVDVSESAAVNEEQSLSVLNMLLDKGKITVEDYLERIPRGLVPDSAKLIQKEGEQNDRQTSDY